jgi:DNA-directed RNA polymerase specialized sigma24 family protein
MDPRNGIILAPEDQQPVRSARFQTTRWTVVLASRQREEPARREAVESLCRDYWYPLYAYVRRTGRSAEDAQDLTQAFFARLLESDRLEAAAPEKGRFRTFLLVAFKRFLTTEWRRGQTQKRGGGAFHVSMSLLEAENRYAAEAVDTVSPDILFDRQWALTLLDRAMQRLQEDYVSSGRADLFEALKGLLAAPAGADSSVEAAAAAGLSEGAARVAVHRMRRRFRDFFREELAQTVTPEEMEEELWHVRKVLSQ